MKSQLKLSFLIVGSALPVCFFSCIGAPPPVADQPDAGTGGEATAGASAAGNAGQGNAAGSSGSAMGGNAANAGASGLSGASSGGVVGSSGAGGSNRAGAGGAAGSSGASSAGAGGAAGSSGGGVPPSCVGLGATCGANGTENCCAALPVSGGTFYRSYDGVSFTDLSFPATVSDFRLDRFEVTVGRFRKFVAAWDANWRPSFGAGKHTHLNSGLGLAATSGGGFEQGWDTSWSSSLATTSNGWDTNLACSPGFQTWSSTDVGGEDRPIDCLSWYEAFAFCIWDQAFLPSETEAMYAGAGGSEQRVYPWSTSPTSTTIDCTYANFGSSCATVPNNVGSESPKGDGKYGQADLGGNVWEWAFDSVAAFVNPCVDCADIVPPTTFAALRGGAFNSAAADLEQAHRDQNGPAFRTSIVGVRCARAP